MYKDPDTIVGKNYRDITGSLWREKIRSEGFRLFKDFISEGVVRNHYMYRRILRTKRKVYRIDFYIEITLEDKSKRTFFICNILNKPLPCKYFIRYNIFDFLSNLNKYEEFTKYKYAETINDFNHLRKFKLDKKTRVNMHHIEMIQERILNYKQQQILLDEKRRLQSLSITDKLSVKWEEFKTKVRKKLNVII